MEDASNGFAAGSGDSEAPSGMERRLVLRLLAYWRNLSDEGSIPSFDQVDPESIPEIWANCFVIDLSGAEDEPVIRVVGENLAKTSTVDLVDLPLSQLPQNTLIERATGYVGEVVRKSVPISRGGEFVKGDGTTVLYRSVILPMSDDGETLCGLLGAANCREVPGD
jgi:hypothetical protein